MIKRRQFITSSAMLAAHSLVPCSLIPILSEAAENPPTNNKDQSAYKTLVESLLQSWCDGMIRHQIVDINDPARHGALWCPACQKIHGRCMDSVYPFMHMAHKTGDERYLNAAILSMEWSKNVSKEDGSWTVIPDPKSWAGITVFGAIALAEALHYHSDILPTDIEQKWRARLAKAADYVYKHFDLTFTNINYGATAIYAFLVIGEVLNDSKLVTRSRELAKGIKAFFTQPNALLFGEGKPSQSRSAKGLLPIDLGYNVEESLNALVMYALHENDQELLKLLEQSLHSHLEFMLPDGGWDNSWGTRQAKWSYWGSRTTDGSQPAYGMMADISPVFGSAAFLNTELLANCTEDGLLHGGPHYVSHGVLPCIHHTFAHAKPLAFLLDNPETPNRITKNVPLPRSKEYGVKHFSELDVWLIAEGRWRATISAYDALYKENNQSIQQASGGALAMVWHELTGPLMTASMPEYRLVEKNNQQPQPNDEDIALTPRIEAYDNSGKWFSNLYDLSAKVRQKAVNQGVMFDIEVQIKDHLNQSLDSRNQIFDLRYTFNQDSIEISARRQRAASSNEDSAFLVIPVIATSDEQLAQLSKGKFAIIKEKAAVIITSQQSIRQRKTAKSRVFNMVPGMEAVVFDLELPKSENQEVTCNISVNPIS